MAEIYDGDELIADIPISQKQVGILEKGEEVTVIFHTPQLLHSVLGTRSGSFTLRQASGRITTKDADAVKHYASLQKSIRAARGTN